MAPRQPILGDLELRQVQEIETAGERSRTRHEVPGLEGDFLQDLGRRGTRIELAGVLTGPESGAGLARLRESFRAAEAVPFVSDIATATRVGDVVIEDLAVRELAGKPERFAYALTLRESAEAPATSTELPPEIEAAEIPDESIAEDVGTLVVEVDVVGESGFDFSRVTVSGRSLAGDAPDLSRTASSSPAVASTLVPGPVVPRAFSRTLVSRRDNVWTEEMLPAGTFMVEAQAPGIVARAASAPATIRPGETTLTTLSLLGANVVSRAFMIHHSRDSAFIEPCMKPVLAEVAEYAGSHPREKLVIVGHTDKIDSPRYNQALSERRARAAYAWLTSAAQHEGLEQAVEEWNLLRQERPAGESPSVRDNWGLTEGQHMLQELGFFPGKVDGKNDALTKEAVRAFRCRNDLPPGTKVDAEVWEALIRAYLKTLPLAVEKHSFLPNCDGTVLEWLGCGEHDALTAKSKAHRPSRRTEFLFVTADRLPGEIFRPVTLDLPPPESGTPVCWDLGPEDPEVKLDRAGFLVPARPQRRDPQKDAGKLLRPTSPTIEAKGSIHYEDKTPFGGEKFVLTAPDGTLLASESSNGKGIPAKTDKGSGGFSFPGLPPGVYTLEVTKEVLVHLADGGKIRGNTVCQRLENPGDKMNVEVSPAPVLREITLRLVAHLITAVDAAGKVVHETTIKAANVEKALAGVNEIWRQARVRFELAGVVRSTYRTYSTQPQISIGEFRMLRAEYENPSLVHVFFVAGFEDPPGGPPVHGGTVSFEMQKNTGVRLPGSLVEDLADSNLRRVVLAHELGHFLNLDHPDEEPGAKGPFGDRLMFGGYPISPFKLLEPETNTARGSEGARLECVPLRIDVPDAHRVDGLAGRRFVVLQKPDEPDSAVVAKVVISPRLLDPAVGTLTTTDLAVSLKNKGITPITATYTPVGGGLPTITTVWIHVVSFPPLDVPDGKRVSSQPHPTFLFEPGRRVTVKANVEPLPVLIPRDLIIWSDGEEHKVPNWQTVDLGVTPAVELTATMAGTSRTVILRTSRVTFVRDSNGEKLEEARIEGVLDRSLKGFRNRHVLRRQRPSLFRVRAEVSGIPESENRLAAELFTLRAGGIAVSRRDLTLRRVQPNAPVFESLPILAVPKELEPEIELSDPPDLEIVGARAGQRLQVVVHADIPLSDLGRDEITLRGRLLRLFVVVFKGVNLKGGFREPNADVLKRHLERASRVWAQAGIEVRTVTQRVDVDTAPGGTLILSHDDNTGDQLTQDEKQLVGDLAPSPRRSSDPKVLNVYYVRNIVGGGGTEAGEVGGVAYPDHPVIAIAGQRVSDTVLAHEIGHQILEGRNAHFTSVSTGVEVSNTVSKDVDEDNVMFRKAEGGTHLDPDQVDHLLCIEDPACEKLFLKDGQKTVARQKYVVFEPPAGP